MADWRGLFEHKLVRFVVVGGGAAALFSVLNYLSLRLGFPPFAGGVMAYGVSFVVAYLLQRNWAFRRSDSHRRTLPKYLAAQLACALLSGAMTHVLGDIGYGAEWTVFLSTVVVAAVSFLLSSRWVFRDQADPR